MTLTSCIGWEMHTFTPGWGGFIGTVVGKFITGCDGQLFTLIMSHQGINKNIGLCRDCSNC